MILSVLIPLAALADSVTHIRVNQVGYLPDAPKVAVVCSLEPREVGTFTVTDERGRRVFGPARVRSAGAFGACGSTHRLDFSALRREGIYRVNAGGVTSRPVRVSRAAYAGGADTLLMYMRQQRSGYSTNEPIMDGTANLTYLLAAMAAAGR